MTKNYQCINDDNISLYQAYKSKGKITDENEMLKAVSFSYGEKAFTVYITKQRATKSTHIDCRANNTIYWINYILCGKIGSPAREEKVLIKPDPQNNEISIVLIKGKPAMIKGLDEGFYLSYKGIPKTNRYVYVMTESEFKLFNL